MSGPGVTLSASAAVMKSSSVPVSGSIALSLPDRLHIAKGGLVDRAVVSAPAAHDRTPPPGLRIAVAVALELGPGSLVNGLCALDGICRQNAFLSRPSPADLRMQHLIGPVVVVKVRGQRVPRFF